MNMKKKILTGIAMCFALILSVIAAGGIYYFVLTEEITLDGIPAPDIQEQLDVYVEARLCKEAYINEDETAAIVHLTRYQKKKWIKWITDSMSSSLEDANKLDNMEFQISEDVKELTLSARQNVSYSSVGTYGLILTYDMEIYQLLMGEEEWSVHFILKDMDTDEILYTANYPEENIRVYDYLWDK